MPLQIVDAGQVRVENTVVTLYGPPNVGKTSLALTASKPLLLDFDDGLQRAVASARQGKAAVRVHTWADIANMDEADFKGYETVIIDTVGTCLDKLMLAVNSSGNLKISEWGELGSRFKALVSKLRAWKLDVVFVAHGAEESRGETTVDRIVAPGNMGKQLVYQSSDLIGRLYIGEGEQRIISFNPTATSFGKNVGTGIPVMVVPDPEKTPDALARIIAQGKHLMNLVVQDEAKAVDQMGGLRGHLEGLTTADGFTQALNKLLSSGGSRPERELVRDTAATKGFVYDLEAKQFVESAPPQPEAVQEPAAETAGVSDDPFA